MSHHQYCVRLSYDEPKIGPIPKSRLMALCRSGVIREQSMVRECGSHHHWHRAESVPLLAVALAIRLESKPADRPAPESESTESLPKCVALCSDCEHRARFAEPARDQAGH